MMRLGAAVIYVDEVAPDLEFHRAAFALETRSFDPDVQLEGRIPPLATASL
jgi:hypothetical protein